MVNKTKKVILSVLAFLVLAGGIVAGVFLVQRNQDIREKAAPATSLSFIPSSVTKNPGQTVNLTVNADTGENKITGIDIEVSFDPDVIQLSEMSALPGISPLTANIIKNGVIDNTAGTARYAAFTINRDAAIFGNLDMLSLVGTITNSAVSGSSEVSFTTLTTISAVDEGVNVIVNKSSATINVSSGTGGGGSTATPTSAGTAVPTATPTTAGGVGGAGVGATATPVRTATPRPSTTATSAPAVTLPPDVPVTGVSLPLLGTVTLGIGALIFSLFLAL